MAKLKSPPDLLATHRHIADRVLWLETHANGELGENASIRSHVHDIVEHLFRGSQQAHLGVAPFGHLAAHYWQMEHDDPGIKGDYEFHRKMRVLRERVGANKPVADVMNQSLRGTNGVLNPLGVGSTGPGGVIGKKGFKEEPTAYTAPANPHLQYTIYGSVLQPYIVPGDPGRYASHFSVSYHRDEEPVLGPKGEVIGFKPEVNLTSQDGEDSKMAEETAGPSQVITPSQHFSYEAVNVAFFNESFSRGGALQANSRRWVSVLGGYTFPYTPGTLPNEALDGSNVGRFRADTLGGTVPDDIFIWCDRGFGPISLYPDTGTHHKDRLWVKNGQTDSRHCGVYGGMWYEAYDPAAFVPRSEWAGQGKRAYFPCDFLQSPGPPVDYGYTEGKAVYGYFEFGVDPPANDAVITSSPSFDKVINDPGKPLRSFDEAVEIFEAIKGEPIFRELLGFWTRHSADFHRSGSPFNHGWTQAPNVGTDGAEPSGKAEYLQRYGYCHLRGRISWRGNNAAFGILAAWTLNQGEIPQPTMEKSLFFPGAYLDFTCNSNIGPVRVRLRRTLPGEFTVLLFPDWGSQYGLGTESNIAWIDLDGISYPCEEI